MNAPRLFDVGAIVGRNVIPVFGLVLLGWDAAHLVLLYYVDTIFAIASVLVLFFIHSKDRPEGYRFGVRDIFGLTVASVILVGAFALVFAWPLVIVADHAVEIVQDRGFQGALAGQLLAAAMWFATWNRKLRGRDDREVMLRKRFEFVAMCWVAVFAAVMFIPWAPALVVVYAGAGIYFELKPPE